MTDRQTALDFAVTKFRSGEGYTVGDLIDFLLDSGMFGDDEDEVATIFTTAVTKAASEETEQEYERLKKIGVPLALIWQTQRDELVCQTCSSRHNKPRGDEWRELPPAHDGCRCDVVIAGEKA